MMAVASKMHCFLSSSKAQITLDEKFGYVNYPDGYTAMHRSLDRYYGDLLYDADQDLSQESSFARDGYVTGKLDSCDDMLCYWRDLIVKNSDKRNIQELLISDSDLLKRFTTDWVGLVNSKSMIEQNGSKLLVYNAFTDILVPSEDRLSVSGNWHYDNYTPGNYVRYMFFLNDYGEHCGGIDLYSREWSHKFSDTTGYVGLPIDNRLNDINQLCDHYDIDESSIINIRPSTGDYLSFSSSRCLHRGINPTKGPRYVVFVCGIPISSSVPTDSIIEYSQALLQRQSPGTDIIPIFRKNISSTSTFASSKSPTVRLDNTELSHDYLADELCKQLSLGSESIYAKWIRFFCDRPIKFTSQINLINAIQSDLHVLSIVEPTFKALSDKFNAYIKSVSIEYSRYNPDNIKKRSDIFWPNPTHPKYPRALADELPFVKRFPLINKDTALATAGSCFAYEIARIFQEKGYNYLVTEKPDPTKGVYASDYDPTDKYVPFSANFGILFNTPSLYQIAQRAFGEFLPNRLLMKRGDIFHDPYRETVFFASQEAYDYDYNNHTLALQELFTKVEVFVFTMGLNECWSLKSDGSVISRNPDQDLSPYVKHRRLTVADNIKSLESFYKLVKRYNPGFKLILSLSPIPFLATGLADTDHVISANSHSKSVLRVAAQELSDMYDDIYYFPSYEYIHYCDESPWEDDLRHVRRDTVSKVVNMFEQIFVS